MKNRASIRSLGYDVIKSQIHQFILAKVLSGEDPVNLTETTPLVSGGIIDSINVLKVGLFLEKAFSIKIAPEDLANPENIETIASMTRLVMSKVPRSR
jgi:acyl carrier protein